MQASLDENDLTIVSIFVNPAQFAPHEDLASYPRTMPTDAEALSKLSSSQPLPNSDSSSSGGSNSSSSSSSSSTPRKVSAIFAPAVTEMYPSGLTQVVSEQVGAFVEVKGLSHQMEGGSRPTFFRGVATVCTKLFHVVLADRLYFGQKDIQQAIILRRMLRDLLFPFPERPEDLRVMPTGRDARTGLALSSRNAYLSPKARETYAPCLYRALQTGQAVWDQLAPSSSSSSSSSTPGGSAAERVRKTLQAARAVVLEEAERSAPDGVRLQLDYISLNHPETLENLEEVLARHEPGAAPRAGEGQELPHGYFDRAIMSGAVLASDLDASGKQGRVTRLIDNVLLGFRM